MKIYQSGIGLVEVLVSLIILALSILGFSALQMSSIKATSESVDRAQVLVIMRSFADKVRANSSAINTYVADFNSINSNSLTTPTKLCVSGDGTAVICDATELAHADVYRFSQQLKDTELKMDLLACPSTGGTSSANIMYSHCLIAAWGDTKPTIGKDDDPTDGSMDCLVDTGTYHPKSTCMFMEVN